MSITATKSTRQLVGSCTSCRNAEVDNPQGIVWEVSLHEHNGLTFRLCREHKAEMIAVLRATR